LTGARAKTAASVVEALAELVESRRRIKALSKTADASAIEQAEEASAEEEELPLDPLSAIEKQLLDVERHIEAYHGSQLVQWTHEQQTALRIAEERDAAAIGSQREFTEGALESLQQTLKRQKIARQDAGVKMKGETDNCEAEFAGQLRVLGDTHTAQSASIVAKGVATMTANGEKWMDARWDHFDAKLRSVILQHAKLVEGPSLAEGMAELHDSGYLAPHLETEKRGWSESQDQDLKLLQGEIAKEHATIFAELSAKLKELSPKGILVQERSHELTDLIRGDLERLQAYEAEVRAAYRTEIHAALAQGEEDYKGYDMELQAILFRTLRKRFADTAHMRRLKLALCRWRLDYQRVFHEHCDRFSAAVNIGAPPPDPPADRTAREHDEKRLEQVRQLVLDLWSRNKTPNEEIHRFLVKVTDAAARDGRAAGLAKVYNDELKQYGALPLVEPDAKPDVVECWLESLSRGSRASRRSSGMSRV